ncbi:MAG: hypothetical protein K8H99_13525, partial [Nitrospirae bacterium]|nr:hypothetical protein [Fimbriimonadaceae bacterium]
MEYPGFCRAGQCKPRMVAIGPAETCLVVHGDLRCWNDPNKPAKDQQFYSFDKDVVEVAVGFGDKCVRFADATARCWGGQSEVSDTVSPYEAVSLPAGSIAQIRVSTYWACVVTLPGRQVRCWGSTQRMPSFPGSAEVSYGHMMDIPAVPLAKPVVSIATGSEHACAVDDEQRVFCWGEGSYGQLGYGSTNSRGSMASDFATQVPVGVLIGSVVAGGNWTCATTPSGAMRCWGDLMSHGNGRIYGDNEAASQGGNLQLGGTAVALATGSQDFYHTCALRTDGHVLCWGRALAWNFGGQLGYEDSEDIGDDERPNARGSVNVGEEAVYVTTGGSFGSASCAIGV